MKIVVLIARLLLALAFVVFGLNGFLNFIPQPPMRPGLLKDYVTVLSASHFVVVPFALQLICGVLFLVNRFVPLALVLIGPVIVNILMIHALMDPAGIAPGLVVTVCWFILFFHLRSAFAGIFEPRAA